MTKNYEFIDELPSSTIKGAPQGYIDPRRAELAAMCRENPGKWTSAEGLYSGNPNAFAHSVRAGSSPAFRPKGDYECQVRNKIPWVRYNPAMQRERKTN
jgi:hypothetical protein